MSVLMSLAVWCVALVFACTLERFFGWAETVEHRLENASYGVFAWLAVSLSSLVSVALLWPLLDLARALHLRVPCMVLDQGYFGSRLVGPVVWMLLYDGLYYVWHRCQHRYALLWWVHRLHHSDRAMSATTYLRQNVLESLLQAAFVLSPMLAVLRMVHASSWWFVFAATALVQFVAHADVPFHWGGVVSPRLHRLHHARSRDLADCNYAGVFPLWDRLGRTYRGIVSYRVPTGLHTV